MMELKNDKNNGKEEISALKRYIKIISRIAYSSLIGSISGLGMSLVYIFWSAHFIPELFYVDTISSFPIIAILLQALFILGPAIIAGFLSTSIKNALITGIVVAIIIGAISMIFNIAQGIINVLVVIFGAYYGGRLVSSTNGLKKWELEVF